MPLETPLLVERRGDEPGREPAGRGQGDERVLQGDGEQVLEEEAEHEDRHRDAGVGDDHRAGVGRRVALVGGDDSERDADEDGEREGDDGQLDRRRQAFDEDLGDAATLAERVAEVAREQVPEERDELVPDRLVEPVALVERIAGRRRRPLAEGGAARIAGDHAGHDEHGGDDPEQHRDRRNQTVDDETDHGNDMEWGRAGARPAPKYQASAGLTPRRAVG